MEIPNKAAMLPQDELEYNQRKAWLRPTPESIERPTSPQLPEDLVAEEAQKLAEDPTDPASLEAATEIVIGALNHRIGTYHALARIATRPDSLPGRLAVQMGYSRRVGDRLIPVRPETSSR